LIAETFIGPAPSKKHHAAHADGNKLNNAASNLRWATAKENCDDMRKHGRRWSKMTDDQVLSLRAFWTGFRGEIAEAARRYNVERKTITSIIKRETWRHI
jgi:hypothetical protein